MFIEFFQSQSMVSGGFKKCQSYLIKNLWKLEWVLFSLHASLYVRYHYFPRNTCLLPDKMAILQEKKQTLKIISTCTSSVYSRKKRHIELSKSSYMSIITFSVHFLVRLFNFFLFVSIHPSIHLVSSFIHLVILSSIYFIQLLVHLYHQSISFHFIYPQYYNSCMIHFYSVTCIQTKEHIQFSFFFFLFFK